MSNRPRPRPWWTSVAHREHEPAAGQLGRSNPSQVVDCPGVPSHTRRSFAYSRSRAVVFVDRAAIGVRAFPARGALDRIGPDRLSPVVDRSGVFRFSSVRFTGPATP